MGSHIEISLVSPGVAIPTSQEKLGVSRADSFNYPMASGANCMRGGRVCSSCVYGAICSSIGGRSGVGLNGSSSGTGSGSVGKGAPSVEGGSELVGSAESFGSDASASERPLPIPLTFSPTVCTTGRSVAPITPNMTAYSIAELPSSLA